MRCTSSPASFAAGLSARSGRTIFDISGRCRWACCVVMESRPSVPAQPSVSEPSASLAEDLPELYREILDRVADLERIGARAEAARIRIQATRVYSDAWDQGARRDLAALLTRAERASSAQTRSRGWLSRRLSTASR
jgi:hypothetical protein